MYYIWTIIKGIMLWAIQTGKNDNTFNNFKWNGIKLGRTIWEGLLNYDILYWNRALLHIDKSPLVRAKLLT